jgi:hypothetical protein
MASSNIESGIWTSSTSGLLKKVSYGAAATHEPRKGAPPPASVRRGEAEAGVKGKAPDWSSGLIQSGSGA